MKFIYLYCRINIFLSKGKAIGDMMMCATLVYVAEKSKFEQKKKKKKKKIWIPFKPEFFFRLSFLGSLS